MLMSRNRWTTVGFGRYADRNMSLPQIVLIDPDYFFWAYKTRAFTGALAVEAEVIYPRARAIRVPYEVEYVHQNGKVVGLQPKYGSSTPSNVDLAYPRQFGNYDKLAYKNVMSRLKSMLFGDKKYRLTRKRCEEFFLDDANFVLGE